MRLIARFLNFFFHHLYHGLAFAYDLVAAIVSFGQWNEWTKTIIPYIEGTLLLELGHGPGHLQRIFWTSACPPLDWKILPDGMPRPPPTPPRGRYTPRG